MFWIPVSLGLQYIPHLNILVDEIQLNRQVTNQKLWGKLFVICRNLLHQRYFLWYILYHMVEVITLLYQETEKFVNIMCSTVSRLSGINNNIINFIHTGLIIFII